MNTSLLGRWGESLVAEELRRRGCRVSDPLRGD